MQKDDALPYHLNKLIGLPLWSIGSACDLLLMQFGNQNVIIDRRGETRTVGDFALHVNTPWRFHRDGTILVGNRDMHYDSETGEFFDWDGDGTNRFHIYAQKLNIELGDDGTIVTKVTPDATGGFTLTFSKGLVFDAMPNASHDSSGMEFWRMFSPGNDGRHLVIGTNGR